MILDAEIAQNHKTDASLIASDQEVLTFPIQTVRPKPAAAKLQRIARIREQLLAGTYQDEDILDTVVDRLWADMQTI